MNKIKKIILISIGFALATYLLMSGFAILNQESNISSKVHSDAVE